jgi:hypothetical protein
LASRFLAFCGAFAFARWRDLALVMSSSPFQVALSNFDDPLRQSVKPFCEYLSAVRRQDQGGVSGPQGIPVRLLGAVKGKELRIPAMPVNGSMDAPVNARAQALGRQKT